MMENSNFTAICRGLGDP